MLHQVGYRKAGGGAAFKPPAQKTGGIMHKCDGQPRKGRSCDCPDAFGLFSDLWETSFEDIHPNVYIFCHLMLLHMIIHSSSRVTSARPLGLWSFPQEMFLPLEAVLWLLGSSALSSRAAHWGPRCFLLLLCQQGFEEMGFFPGEIDGLHLTFKLSSRINLPLREQEEDRAAFSSSYSPLPEFSSRDFSFSSVSFSLSNFASSQTKRAAIPIWTFN